MSRNITRSAKPSGVVDATGAPVTQERWDRLEIEVQRLRAGIARKRILRLPEIIDRVGLSRAQIYKLMDAGEFPQSIKLTERTIGWLEHEIDAYIDARVAASRAP